MKFPKNNGTFNETSKITNYNYLPDFSKFLFHMGGFVVNKRSVLPVPHLVRPMPSMKMSLRNLLKSAMGSPIHPYR